MNTHSLTSNLTTSSLYTAGLLSFVTGQFILSTTLFGMACLATNIKSAKAKPIRV